MPAQAASRPSIRRVALLLAVLCLAAAAAYAALSGAGESALAIFGVFTTERVSVDSSGVGGDNMSIENDVSGDARFVAFDSCVSSFVASDSNGLSDIFVRDRQAGTTERVSLATDGGDPDGESLRPKISKDGRYVAFVSAASNLVAGDTNGKVDVFVCDRTTGTITRASVSSSEEQGDDYAEDCDISADGRYVAFDSYATNMAADDTNGAQDVFVRDMVAGTTERASLPVLGEQAPYNSNHPSLSSNGRYLAFESQAPNLVWGDLNSMDNDIFVRDMIAGVTELASVNSSETQGLDWSVYPAISADGRYVAFSSNSTNLAGEDTNGATDIFRRDRLEGTTVRASLTWDGAEGNGACSQPAISGGGRYVVFHSYSTNLVEGDTNDQADVFVRDVDGWLTDRVSVASIGTQANSISNQQPSVSADGQSVVFASFASNLVAEDYNGNWDVFLRFRTRPRVTATASQDGALIVKGRAYGTTNVVDGVRASFDGGSTWTNATADDGAFDSTEESYTVSLLPPNGPATVLVEAQGLLGLVHGDRAVLDVDVDLDLTAPRTTAPTLPRTFSQSAVIDLSVEETGSGWASTRWAIDNKWMGTGKRVTSTIAGTHTLTFSSLDVAGNREATRSATFTVTRSTAVAFTSRAAVIGYGANVRVTGTLKDGSRVLANKKVSLYSSADKVTWSPMGKSDYTDSAGAFSITVKPAVKTYYQARFAATGPYLASRSAATYYIPKAYVSTPVPSTATVYAGRAFGVTGYLQPKHTAGGRSVAIKCYRSESGRWVLRATFYAVNYDNTTSTRYTYGNVVLPYAGSWKIVATHSDTGHAYTESLSRPVTAR